MFIRVKERRDGDEVLINTDHISMIWEDSSVLVMCGNHGQGNGLIHTTPIDIARIFMHIEVDE